MGAMATDARAALAKLRRLWVLPTLLVALGIGVGVWLATYVGEPDYVPILLRVLANEYRPFGVLVRYTLLLTLWLVFCYMAARFRFRLPYLAFCLLAAYWMGRVALFCVTAGVWGIVGLVLLETLCFLVCYIFSLVYYAHLADMLFCSLRPSFNRAACRFGLTCLAVGAAILLLYLVVLWGIAAKVINLVV